MKSFLAFLFSFGKMFVSLHAILHMYAYDIVYVIVF